MTSQDPTINLVLETIKLGKQAIVFANTKASAEKTAEDISKLIKNKRLINLKEQALNSLQQPTKQCERLALCIEKGIAFHHAGLTTKQKDLIETEFKNKIIDIIVATPTLAIGVDLPAYRVILKDLKRHTKNGLTWIPTLEYMQMSGRAGRPKYDKIGQSIAIAKNNQDKEEITNRYIYGHPEDIYSKLAVEPVLRTYTLSLISTNYVKTKQQLISFFEKTFWAHQFQDMDRIEQILNKMINLLEEFEFIKTNNDEFKPTPIGKRVSELYIDPLTANQIIVSLRKAATKDIRPFSLLQMITSTLEMRPLLRIKINELEELENELVKYEPELITEIPDSYDHNYDEYLQSVKTAFMFLDWINENTEDRLLEKYNTKPGELHAKINNADWLLYASEELSRLLQFHDLIKEFSKLRIRLKYGAKEDILTLLKLKNIGKVRARKLYVNKIKTIQDIKDTDLQTISDLIGKTTAIDIKKQVGENIEAVKENKRKGQISLMDYR